MPLYLTGIWNQTVCPGAGPGSEIPAIISISITWILAAKRGASASPGRRI
jgi:hypothetical protein